MRRTKLTSSSGIYKIQSTVNSKIYIGSSVNLKRRMHEHLSSLKKKDHGNRYMQRHINKYGLKDLRFSIIEFCTKEKLIEREQYYINTLNPEFNLCSNAKSVLGTKHSKESKQKSREVAILLMKDPDRRQNLREAAIKQFADPKQRKSRSDAMKIRSAKGENPMSGKHHTEESKRKMREALKGKRKGKNNPMYGRKRIVSEETRQKLRESSRIANMKRCKPVKQYDLNGTYIIAYPSQSEAGRQTGINPNNISSCVSGRLKTTGGFIWKRAIK